MLVIFGVTFFGVLLALNAHGLIKEPLKPILFIIAIVPFFPSPDVNFMVISIPVSIPLYLIFNPLKAVENERDIAQIGS